MTTWKHRCGCGLVYDECTWRALRVITRGETYGSVDIEMRNCICGNTLARIADHTVADIMRIIVVARKAWPVLEAIQIGLGSNLYELAYQWGQAGMGPEETKAWLGAHCFAPGAALELEIANVSPELAGMQFGDDEETTIGFALSSRQITMVEVVARLLPLLNDTKPEA